MVFGAVFRMDPCLSSLYMSNSQVLTNYLIIIMIMTRVEQINEVDTSSIEWLIKRIKIEYGSEIEITTIEFVGVFICLLTNYEVYDITLMLTKVAVRSIQRREEHYNKHTLHRIGLAKKLVLDLVCMVRQCCICL